MIVALVWPVVRVTFTPPMIVKALLGEAASMSSTVAAGDWLKVAVNEVDAPIATVRDPGEITIVPMTCTLTPLPTLIRTPENAGSELTAAAKPSDEAAAAAEPP